MGVIADNGNRGYTYASGGMSNRPEREVEYKLQHRLHVSGGKLIYTDIFGRYESHAVPVRRQSGMVRIGCMELTMEAFELIVKRVAVSR
jgi:hypothetical protein